MLKWNVIFDDVSDSLEKAKRNHKYSDKTTLSISLILTDNKCVTVKTELNNILNALWHLSESFSNTMKIVIQSTRGRMIYYNELYAVGKRGAMGDRNTIEKFASLKKRDRLLTTRLVSAQIEDRLKCDPKCNLQTK